MAPDLAGDNLDGRGVMEDESESRRWLQSWSPHRLVGRGMDLPTRI